jgi:DNA-binding transcriptional LysR family regulator
VSIAHFKVFRDIAESKSISQAAALNSISQSAVSQTVKALEKQLGVELVDRTTRPLQLTAAGSIYYEASKDIVRRHQEMESQIESHKTILSGTVHVVSIYSIGLSEITQYKARFLEMHPETRIHLEFMRPDKIYDNLIADRADIGLVSYPTPSKALSVIDWRREQMVFVCHPDHELAGYKTITPQDLARRDFISFDQGLSIRKALDRFFREHGVTRGVQLEFDNILMIKEALSINQGVSILPERTVRQEVEQRRLVAIPIAASELVRPVGILLNRKRKLSRTADEFLSFLRGNAKTEAA